MQHLLRFYITANIIVQHLLYIYIKVCWQDWYRPAVRLGEDCDEEGDKRVERVCIPFKFRIGRTIHCWCILLEKWYRNIERRTMYRRTLFSGNPGNQTLFRSPVESSAASLVPKSSCLFPAVPFRHDVLICSLPNPSARI